MPEKVSVVTILHGEKEFIPLILHNFQNFNDQETLELLIVDDGPENLMKYLRFSMENGLFENQEKPYLKSVYFERFRTHLISVSEL